MLAYVFNYHSQRLSETQRASAEIKQRLQQGLWKPYQAPQSPPEDHRGYRKRGRVCEECESFEHSLTFATRQISFFFKDATANLSRSIECSLEKSLGDEDGSLQPLVSNVTNCYTESTKQLETLQHFTDCCISNKPLFLLFVGTRCNLSQSLAVGVCQPDILLHNSVKRRKYIFSSRPDGVFVCQYPPHRVETSATARHTLDAIQLLVS